MWPWVKASRRAILGDLGGGRADPRWDGGKQWEKQAMVMAEWDASRVASLLTRTGDEEQARFALTGAAKQFILQCQQDNWLLWKAREQQGDVWQKNASRPPSGTAGTADQRSSSSKGTVAIIGGVAGLGWGKGARDPNWRKWPMPVAIERNGEMEVVKVTVTSKTELWAVETMCAR